MDEAEWLACNDALEAVVFLRERLDPRTLRHPFRRLGRRLRRKLRLFAGQLAVLQYMQRDEHLDDPAWFSEWLYVQDDIDRWSEDRLSFKELSGESAYFFGAFERRIYRSLEVWVSPWTVATRSVRAFADGAYSRSGIPACSLLRDIFGNPFRPVAFSIDWRTGTAVSLAQQVYESYDFSALPILADALQDAGCDNADILDHCRGHGPHARGCWPVDAVLGRS